MFPIKRSVLHVLLASLTALSSSAAHAIPSDVPLFLKQGASPNVLLNLSVETPMGGAAYNDQADGSVSVSSNESTTAGFAHCSNENGTCVRPGYTGLIDVRYGAGSSYFQRTNLANGVACSNGVFGDPVSGVAKQCYARVAQNPPPANFCTGRRNVTISGDTSEYGTCYFPTKTYLGYFDPNKCYHYTTDHFSPVGAASSTHECTSRWSGNFLNWSSMTAIDMLIMTMSGGNRVVDTTTSTLIERARKQNNDGWFPYKILDSQFNVAPSTVTPFTDSTLVIYNTDFGIKFGNSKSNALSSTEYRLRVKVCDHSTAAGGLEANCVAYGSPTPYYKPEGLIQKNSERMRFAVTSYTLDGDNNRDGGVLRSNIKYVGPRHLDGTGNWVVNPNGEWGTDGLLVHNPDNIDSSTNLNSGVVNYLNRFSEKGYKSKDPAAELYYEGLRYFKHLGPTPEYSSGITRNATDARCGGFWFANSANEWNDPVQYRCQRNFIVGINDANPWLDKRLPGTHFTANKVITFSPARSVKMCGTTADASVTKVWDVATGPCSNAATTLGGTGTADCASREYIVNNCQLTADDYGPPSNADTDIDVTALTNTVGSLEGLHTTWSNTGTWTSVGSSGTTLGANDSVGGTLGSGGNFDGTCTAKSVSGLGEAFGTCQYPPKQNSYYLAGLSYYANISDLRPDFDGKQSVSTFFIDTQEYGTNPLDGNKNMLWLAGKYGGFIDSNNNNRPDLQSEWDPDGDGSPDNYVLATRPEKLVTGLSSAFQDILSRTSTSTAVVASSGSISSTTRIFQAKFDTTTWTGRLLAYSLNSDATVNATLWDTNTPGKIPAAAARNIYTWDPLLKAGTQFLWSGTAGQVLTDAQKNLLDPTNLAAASSPILDYLRGVQTNEKTGTNPAGTLRPRPALLGDIINSSPIYVAPANFGYEVLEPGEGGGALYKTYRKSTRTPVVYVGANDGMLHGFNAANGGELFAYVPNAVIAGGMKNLASVNYAHKSFVDGPSAFSDAYIGGHWKTVLVGSMGGGGHAVFALDVTDPNALAGTAGRSKVLWELDSNVIADLGYTLQRPVIARMQNDRWAAIYGNGYGSTTSTAKLLIVFLDPDLSNGWTLGSDYVILDTNTEIGSGLSAPAVVLDSRETVTAVYAGDLKGNLWKFDVSSTSTGSWGSAYSSGTANQPLFTATDDSGVPQPITAGAEISLHPLGGHLVYFGTGKYFEEGDQMNAQVQSFYGIWDQPGGSRISYSDRTDALHEVEILSESVTTATRITSPAPTSGIYSGAAARRGWYLDLKVAGSAQNGERVISVPGLLDDRVVFVSIEPSTDPCAAGGKSWIMELNALDGSRSPRSVFDLNNDNAFNSGDFVTTASGESVPPSGISKEGIMPELTLMGGGSSADVPRTQLVYKVSSSSVNGEPVSIRNRGRAAPRSSWRELR